LLLRHSGDIAVFLAEPPATQFDFRFRILGFPVRVTPFFWVVVVLFGWEWADWVHRASQMTAEPMNQGVLLLMWVGAVFFSILVHELGHALAMRYYRSEASIVLYHFGGMAIADSFGSFARMGYRSSGKQNQLVISAAGPAAQLLLALAVVLIALAAGYRAPVPLIGEYLPISQLDPIPSLPMRAMADALMYPSVMWALLNLMPVYPLDGGHISRELFLRFSSDGVRNSLILSVVTGVCLAVYGFMNGRTFLAILFAMLAFSSYQLLQAMSGRGGGFGGRW
jgi:Zn-dependent protease